MVEPLVFQDANLGIVLVSGRIGDQMIYRIHKPSPDGPGHWCSVRKVDERDGFKIVDALNRPDDPNSFVPGLKLSGEM